MDGTVRGGDMPQRAESAKGNNFEDERVSRDDV